MKSFKMRYFFLTPMVVLAMVACAKRDSDFAKRAAEARNAADKTATEAPPAPGLDANPSPKADPATLVDKDTYKGETEGLYKESCKNPIHMEPQEGEIELAMDKIVTKEKGSYVLQSSELYVDHAAKDVKGHNQLHATGSQFELPKDFNKTATDSTKVIPVCHTIKADEASTQKLSENLILPYEISTEDGAVKVLRQDQIEIDHKAVIKTISTLNSKDSDLKEILSDAEGKRSLIVKRTNSDDITIKLQITTTDETSGTLTNVFMSGNYSLKK